MKKISRIILKILGWTVECGCPEGNKFIIIQAPHTSLWDFVYGWLFSRAINIKPKFLIKSKYFFWPLGPILKMLGGVPVYPSKDKRFVSELVNQIQTSKSFILAITPEGTRKKVKRWKTGFYEISRATGLPILLTKIDYSNKKMHLGNIFYPTGDMQGDMRKIQGYFRASWAKHPEKYYEWPPVD